MIRRVAVVLLAAGLAAAMTVGHQVGLSAAATHGGALCTLNGTATFSKGLTTKTQTVSYTFTGSVSSCQSTDRTVKSGSVSAAGSGSISCANGTTSGTASVAWNNGHNSSISFKTTSAGSLTAITGKVTSGEFVGGQTVGAVSFTTTTPQACLKGGLTSLGFTGVISTVV